MRIVAFRRSNSPYLHPDLIVEWGDAAFVGDLTGWETMTEEHFKAELSKNAERSVVHNDWLKKTEVAVQKAEQARKLGEAREARAKDREYARYEAWKRHQGR